MSILYIVSTPIGNLKDISLGALEVLKEVDLILCEDTRVTRKLLDYYNIKTSMLSYHQHSKLKKINHILELLKYGKNLALVSDAGTPGISDPGNRLIDQLIRGSVNQVNQVQIVPIPGPSAVATAASISGLPMDKFLFLGYPPTKKKRKRFFQEIADSKYSIIFYESPHRIIKTLNELNKTVEQYNNKTIKVIVCRELTKKFESIYRGTIDEVIQKVKKDPIKGEYTVVVG